MASSGASKRRCERYGAVCEATKIKIGGKSCEADLRPGSVRQAQNEVIGWKDFSGVERSDEIKRPGSGVDRVFESVLERSIRQFAL
jgi:hypothetical protein